jgi:hypothetical protein
MSSSLRSDYSHTVAVLLPALAHFHHLDSLTQLDPSRPDFVYSQDSPFVTLEIWWRARFETHGDCRGKLVASIQ